MYGKWLQRNIFKTDDLNHPRSWKGCLALRWIPTHMQYSSSSDSFIFASSRLPNTYVCHRTISSERELKECGVRECTTTGTCCSRCATNIEESNSTVCRDSNASWYIVEPACLCGEIIVSKKWKTKLAIRENRAKHPKKDSAQPQKKRFGSTKLASREYRQNPPKNLVTRWE